MSSYVNTTLNYTFSPSAGTINFSGQSNFNWAYLKAVVDQTQNAFIFLPGISGYGGTWNPAGTILTLAFNVSSYASTDKLTFQYDDQGPALANIQGLLSGSNFINGTAYPVMNSIPGATVNNPSETDTIRSLIAEVRMLTQLTILLAHEEIDLDVYKRSILERMPL